MSRSPVEFENDAPIRQARAPFVGRIALWTSHRHNTTDEYGVMSPQTNDSVAIRRHGHLGGERSAREEIPPGDVGVHGSVDLWYSVSDPANPKESVDLLIGISSCEHPATITVLTGSSGAGRSMLLDVITNRKTGGQILLNDYEGTDVTTRSCAGYCEQIRVNSRADLQSARVPTCLIADVLLSGRARPAVPEPDRQSRTRA